MNIKNNKLLNPFFSVIVPTYNRVHFLSTTIESVLYQTFNDWELIIVDDGSTDNTKELIEKYTDSRIRYIWQENQERSAARNNGISISKGQYICFLDSDDYFLKNRLELLHKEIIARENLVAFFYTGILYEKNGIFDKKEEWDNNCKNTLDYIVYNVIGNPQVCVHRTILDQHKYNIQFSISEDMELWIRIKSAGYIFIFLECYTVVATNHDERSVNIATGNNYGKMITLYKFIFSKEHPGNAISKSMQNFVLSNAFYGQARYYIFKNDKWKAVFSLIQSLLLFFKSEQTKHKIFLLYKLLFVKHSNTSKLFRYIGGK